MSRETAHRERLFAELAKQGVAAVEARLAQGVYGKRNEALIREWLRDQTPGPVAPPMARHVIHLMKSKRGPLLRRKPGRVITWIIIGIVVLELLGMVAAAVISSGL